MTNGVTSNQQASLGFISKQKYYEEAFSRNRGLISELEQERLRRTTVAIPGLGGVGGGHLLSLVRAGVGNFHLADRDFFEAVNVNRQVGAKVTSFGEAKTDAMVREALEINPFLNIRVFPDGISAENIDQFLEGVDVVADSLDYFEFDIRRTLINRAREKGIYVVSAGPIGFSAALLVFSPHAGMSFDEYFGITDDMTEQDKYLAFGLGTAPRCSYLRYMDRSRILLGSKSAPSLGLACLLCSGVVTAEILKIVFERGTVKPVPHYRQFDSYLHKYYKGYLWRGGRNPLQRLKFMLVKRFLRNNRRLAGSYDTAASSCLLSSGSS